jgi:sulfoxide reductase heme-binding subunit YedZ
MPSRAIPYLKILVHLLCLLPLFEVILRFQSGALGLMADPVLWITHQTGSAALVLLLISLGVTPARRLHPRLSNLIRFRRMLGLYAFFYATLHLATYAFLFSGYDLPGAYAALRAGHPGVLVDDWKAVWPTITDDLKKRRFVQVGFVSWLLLLALAITSPAAVMRRMGGRMWQQVHKLVYGAAVLAIIHYWWLVKAGNRAPLRMTLILVALFAARLAWSWKRRRIEAVRQVVV